MVGVKTGRLGDFFSFYLLSEQTGSPDRISQSGSIISFW